MLQDLDRSVGGSLNATLANHLQEGELKFSPALQSWLLFHYWHDRSQTTIPAFSPSLMRVLCPSDRLRQKGNRRPKGQPLRLGRLLML